MCVAIIGGMDRLEKHYMNEAERLGITLKVFTKFETEIAKKINRVDAVIIFSDKVSHKAKTAAMKAIKTKAIPLAMHHSCGLSSLRNILTDLKDTDNTIYAIS